MLKAEIYINNNTAHSCSPLEFVRKYILQDAVFCGVNEDGNISYKNQYATILVKGLEQD